MNFTNTDRLIKPCPVIQAVRGLTLLQRRAWNVLLANAFDELFNTTLYSISSAELYAKLGFTPENRDDLKALLKTLVSCEVEWNVRDKDGNHRWGAAGLLAEATIKEPFCTYGYSFTVRHQLNTPRVYAQLNRRAQHQFTSQYASVLWNVCFDYFDTDRAQGETPIISLETFRALMGIAPHEYQNFEALNHHVIEPAIQAINKWTNYHVEGEQRRIGAEIGELKFRLTRNEPLSIQTAYASRATYDLSRGVSELL